MRQSVGGMTSLTSLSLHDNPCAHACAHGASELRALIRALHPLTCLTCLSFRGGSRANSVGPTAGGVLAKALAAVDAAVDAGAEGGGGEQLMLLRRLHRLDLGVRDTAVTVKTPL